MTDDWRYMSTPKKEKPPAIEIQTFLDNGWLIDDMREMYGVGRTTVRRWMTFYGIKGVRGKRSEAPPKDEINRLIEQGMSSEALSDHYGASLSSIGKWLRDYGLLALRARHRAEKKANKPADKNPYQYSIGIVTNNPPQIIMR